MISVDCFGLTSLIVTNSTVVAASAESGAGPAADSGGAAAAPTEGDAAALSGEREISLLPVVGDTLDVTYVRSGFSGWRLNQS